MEIYNYIISGLAVVISGFALWYSKKSASAAERSTEAAYTPIIEIQVDKLGGDENQRHFRFSINNIGRDLARDVELKIYGVDKDYQEKFYKTLLKDHSVNFYIYYQIQKLTDNKIEIHYKDIFNNSRYTFGKFNFHKNNDTKQNEYVEGVTWFFTFTKNET